MNIVFVTGGARSGKSTFALNRALELGGDRVTFIATAEVHDPEMRERVNLHRAERPASWTLAECPLGVSEAVLGAETDVVLLDCLSLLVSNVLLAHESDPRAAEHAARTEVQDLLNAANTRKGTLIVVTNEVGSGVVPAYPLGRAYRDVLGRANQTVAAASREAYLVVAGLPLTLKGHRT